MKLPSDLAEAPAPKKSRVQLIIRAAGLLLGLFLIYWFVSKSPLAGIGEQLKLVNVRFVFLIAVTFVAYLMVTVAWPSFYSTRATCPRLFHHPADRREPAQINPTNDRGRGPQGPAAAEGQILYKDSIVSLTISRFRVILALSSS